MKSIAILTLALTCNALADGIAYKCTGYDGSVFYRNNGCPSHSGFAAPVIGGAGGVALVNGSVRQEVIKRSLACQLARAKWERTLNMSSGRPIPQNYVATVEANISALCY